MSENPFLKKNMKHFVLEVNLGDGHHPKIAFSSNGHLHQGKKYTLNIAI